MKLIRYGQPNGITWVAEHNGLVTASDTRESAKENAEKGIVNYSTGLIAPYEVLKGKSPLLVVGSHAFQRENLPFFILQEFDVHTFFMPTSDPVFQVGVILLSRLNDSSSPIVLHARNTNIAHALRDLMQGVTSEVHKNLKFEEAKPKIELTSINPTMFKWIQLWIYRCPKLSLKDVLALESYSNNTIAS